MRAQDLPRTRRASAGGAARSHRVGTTPNAAGEGSVLRAQDFSKTRRASAGTAARDYRVGTTDLSCGRRISQKRGARAPVAQRATIAWALHVAAPVAQRATIAWALQLTSAFPVAGKEKGPATPTCAQHLWSGVVVYQ